MTDFDEISRAIGNIEGRLAKIEHSQDTQWEKLEKIEAILTNHRLKVAGLAAAISGAIAGLWQWLGGKP